MKIPLSFSTDIKKTSVAVDQILRETVAGDKDEETGRQEPHNVRSCRPWQRVQFLFHIGE